VALNTVEGVDAVTQMKKKKDEDSCSHIIPMARFMVGILSIFEEKAVEPRKRRSIGLQMNGPHAWGLLHLGENAWKPQQVVAEGKMKTAEAEPSRGERKPL